MSNRTTLTLVVTAFIIAATLLAAAYTHTSKASTVCAEDDPCWNCATMGNKLCGPTPSELLACKVAIELGYYTNDLHQQCIDDYRDSRK